MTTTTIIDDILSRFLLTLAGDKSLSEPVKVALREAADAGTIKDAATIQAIIDLARGTP